MKLVLMILVAIMSVACFDQPDNVDSASKKSVLADVKKEIDQPVIQDNTDTNTITSLPNLSDFPRECPKEWGVVKGASLAQVENFIQNYFYVPENPTPMHSEVNRYPQSDGSILIKAGTYKMQDNIVDQEMVASFVGGVMTQCGARLRCANNPIEWVGSCD